MKLQLFLNNILYKDYDLDSPNKKYLKFRDNVNIRHKNLEVHIEALKRTFSWEIKQADFWEIRLVVKSKMVKQ